MKEENKKRWEDWCKWYETLPRHTRLWLQSQPMWYDRDLFKFGAITAVIGFVVGVVVGYEWAYKPVVVAFKPLVG